MAGDELLSAFKVASFAFEEDKEPEPAEPEADDESKDWVSLSFTSLQCT
jgi:hypothetical protein